MIRLHNEPIRDRASRSLREYGETPVTWGFNQNAERNGTIISQFRSERERNRVKKAQERARRKLRLRAEALGWDANNQRTWTRCGRCRATLSMEHVEAGNTHCVACLNRIDPHSWTERALEAFG